jgi:multiple sugar transport system substrate-binding protein
VTSRSPQELHYSSWGSAKSLPQADDKPRLLGERGVRPMTRLAISFAPSMRRWRWRPVLSASAAALAVLALASCGGSASSGGPATLNLWVFQEPSGSFTDAAKRCSQESGGRYRIVCNALSNDADQQRESLVRRLAAKDSSIDIAGMDVVWTAEFADAGWILPWPAHDAAQVSQGTLAGPLQTATYKGRLWAAPANTNTQLLWYRKDLVAHPASTWDGLIAQASALPTAGRIEIQGAQYEGVVVWFNSLVQSVGGTIISGNKVTLGPAGLQAAEIMKHLATSKAADPSISAQMEDQNRLAFEQGEAAFEINYPYIYPSAKADVPAIFKQIGWKPYPAVEAGKPATAPIGGINWGVGAYTKHPAEAFAAAACLRNAQNQREAAIKGGLPPTLSSLYDDKSFQKAYPFSALIRRQVESGAVRPQTPAYADVSLAIATTVSPPSNIQLNGFVNSLRAKLQDALESKGLF